MTFPGRQPEERLTLGSEERDSHVRWVIAFFTMVTSLPWHIIGQELTVSHSLTLMCPGDHTEHQCCLHCWGDCLWNFSPKVSLLLLFTCSVVSNSETSWTVARHAPLSLGFFRKEYTAVGCHFLLQGIFLTQASKPCLLQVRCIAGRFFTMSH